MHLPLQAELKTSRGRRSHRVKTRARTAKSLTRRRVAIRRRRDATRGKNARGSDCRNILQINAPRTHKTSQHPRLHRWRSSEARSPSRRVPGARHCSSKFGGLACRMTPPSATRRAVPAGRATVPPHAQPPSRAPCIRGTRRAEITVVSCARRLSSERPSRCAECVHLARACDDVQRSSFPIEANCASAPSWARSGRPERLPRTSVRGCSRLGPGGTEAK